MASADGRLVITFNGEIYNYRALRRELEAAGARFRTTSDTEVLLHLYAQHGEAMVHKLRGMFAFAIWDDFRRELFLARDPYGIKPLYTANDGWIFRFASQVKALLASEKISRAPEPAGIVGFHLLGSVPEPFTLYRDIRALPAGHFQKVDAVGPREPQCFAKLAELLRNGVTRPLVASQIPGCLRSGLLESVRVHLLSDVELGVFLSAGVDSGAILGLMRDAGVQGVRAITLAFDEFGGTPEDESPLAARVAEHYGARHIVRRVSEREFREDLPSIFEKMDQPSIDGVNTWFVAKAAKELGLKVALSGLGGDELLAGYPSFAELPRWHRSFGALAAVPGLGRLARALIPALAPRLVRQRPKLLGLLEHASTWAGTYLLRRGLLLPTELRSVMDEDVVQEGIRRLDPLRRIGDALVPDPGSDLGRVCALESSQYLRNQLLRDADWAGMAHGLEIRVPLVDSQLLECLAGAIPALTPGLGKRLLAQAPSLALPDEVVNRAKTGFTVPTGNWMNALIPRAGAMAGESGISASSMGIVSREWARVVFAAAAEMPHAA